VPVSLGDLAGGAALILDTFASQLASEGVDVPGVQFVQPGSGASAIAWDGEQLNVSLQEIVQGQPGAAAPGTMYPAATVVAAQWSIVLLRKIPSLAGNATLKLTLPTAAKLDVAGQANMADVAALVNAAVRIHAAYSLQPAGSGFAIDSCRPLGPEGGIAGAQLLLTLSLT
jgi:hypothetical protein